MRPEYRGQGIARRLLESFVEWARGQGVDWIFLESGVNNRRAHDLVERLGFSLTGYVFMLPLDRSLRMPLRQSSGDPY